MKKHLGPLLGLLLLPIIAIHPQESTPRMKQIFLQALEAGSLNSYKREEETLRSHFLYKKLGTFLPRIEIRGGEHHEIRRDEQDSTLAQLEMVWEQPILPLSRLVETEKQLQRLEAERRALEKAGESQFFLRISSALCAIEQAKLQLEQLKAQKQASELLFRSTEIASDANAGFKRQEAAVKYYMAREEISEISQALRKEQEAWKHLCKREWDEENRRIISRICSQIQIEELRGMDFYHADPGVIALQNRQRELERRSAPSLLHCLPDIWIQTRLSLQSRGSSQPQALAWTLVLDFSCDGVEASYSAASADPSMKSSAGNLTLDFHNKTNDEIQILRIQEQLRRLSLDREEERRGLMGKIRRLQTRLRFEEELLELRQEEYRHQCLSRTLNPLKRAELRTRLFQQREENGKLRCTLFQALAQYYLQAGALEAFWRLEGRIEP